MDLKFFLIIFFLCSYNIILNHIIIIIDKIITFLISFTYLENLEFIIIIIGLILILIFFILFIVLLFKSINALLLYKGGNIICCIFIIYIIYSIMTTDFFKGLICG